MKKEEIKDLMEFFDKIGIAKMKIKEGEFELELEKNNEEIVKCSPVPATPQPLPAMQPQQIEIITKDSSKQESKDKITSPMVGTFYVAPAPGASAFVKVGDKVKKGDIVGIIEAMKIMNEIEAEFDCKIIKNLVDDGQPVEFGMGLFEVEKI